MLTTAASVAVSTPSQQRRRAPSTAEPTMASLTIHYNVFLIVLIVEYSRTGGERRTDSYNNRTVILYLLSPLGRVCTLLLKSDFR